MYAARWALRRLARSDARRSRRDMTAVGAQTSVARYIVGNVGVVSACIAIGLSAGGVAWLLAPTAIIGAAAAIAWRAWDVSVAAFVLVVTTALLATPVLDWPLRPDTYLW